MIIIIIIIIIVVLFYLGGVASPLNLVSILHGSEFLKKSLKRVALAVAGFVSTREAGAISAGLTLGTVAIPLLSLRGLACRVAATPAKRPKDAAQAVAQSYGDAHRVGAGHVVCICRAPCMSDDEAAAGHHAAGLLQGF